jgi:hypothetical protein
MSNYSMFFSVEMVVGINTQHWNQILLDKNGWNWNEKLDNMLKMHVSIT